MLGINNIKKAAQTMQHNLTDPPASYFLVQLLYLLHAQCYVLHLKQKMSITAFFFFSKCSKCQ